MSHYGHFSSDYREFIITNPRTPAPWVNYLWNHRGFGGLVSHTGGGYSFFKSPRDNRLTKSCRASTPWDSPGRYLYLRDRESGEFWSATWGPTHEAHYDFYQCRHGQGYTTIETEARGIRVSTTYVVPRNDDAEFWLVSVENRSDRTRNLDLFAYVELLMGTALEDPTNDGDDTHFTDVSFDRDADALFCTRRCRKNEREVSTATPTQSWPHFLVFGSSLPAKGFDGSKDAFIGRWRNGANPEAVELGQCHGTEISAGEPCAVIQNALEIAPGETTRFSYLLGVVEKSRPDSNERLDPSMKKSYAEARRLLAKYRNIAECRLELENVREYWSDHLAAFQVETPEADFNAMINVWNRYQASVTFDIARDGGYPSRGRLLGRNMRDAVLEMWGPLMSESERVKERIRAVASSQCADGSPLPPVPPAIDGGEKVDRSDTTLWLPFGITMYLKETADFAFLKEKVPYHDSGTGTIEEHLSRALRFAIKGTTTRHLPRFGPGDWNEALDDVGRAGKGETIWGAAFLCHNLREASELFLHVKKPERARTFRRWYATVARAVNRHAWDGGWYVRGFDDRGDVIGSRRNKEGKIFLEPQAWAIIAGIADSDRLQTVLRSVHRHLDTPKGVKILHPAFRTVDPNVGLVTRCVPGKKENGSVLNEASSWLVLAELIAGHGDRAWEVYRRMMPPVVGSDSDIYTAEPYVYSEYVTSPDHETYGQAGHSWLTGAAVWMYRTATDWLIGLRPTYDGLLVDPCVPRTWKAFSAIRNFRGSTYAVSFENQKGVSRGIKEMFVDGKIVKGRVLPIGKERYEVRVVMG